ncbi:uncharacterized protein LOC143229024 [Tachypleus tridentatus]|uniref:uncharacterized protein LOC143229024 n=1 Tax=Tachypleus tridentatus TaxID=6853 RepID=UPI003FD13881
MADVEGIFIVLILAAIFSILFAVIIWACCLHGTPKTDKREKEYSRQKPKLTAQEQPSGKEKPEVEANTKQEEITVQPDFLNGTLDKKLVQLLKKEKLSADQKRQSLETLVASVMSTINFAVSLAPYLTETVDPDSPLNNVSVYHENGKEPENPVAENIAKEEQCRQTALEDICVDIETPQEQFL